MRVLFVPSWYPTDKNPFAGSFIRDLAYELSKLEGLIIEVVAFHYHYKTIQKDSYNLKKKDELIEHHFFGWVGPKINRTRQNQWIKKCMYHLSQKLDLNQFDIIHAHDYVSLFLAENLSQRYKKPLLASLHHSDLMMDMIPKWRLTILKDVLHKVDTIIVPSNALKDAIQNAFELIPRTIPNYINSDKIHAKKELPDIPIKYISVGSLEELKNHEEAILWFQNSNSTLDIYGDGPSKKSLQKLIYTHNLQNKVCLKSSLNHEDLLITYSTYDGFISTSNYETFGLSILEALAAGIPVICKNEYGPSDFIN